MGRLVAVALLACSLGGLAMASEPDDDENGLVEVLCVSWNAFGLQIGAGIAVPLAGGSRGVGRSESNLRILSGGIP